MYIGGEKIKKTHYYIIISDMHLPVIVSTTSNILLLISRGLGMIQIHFYFYTFNN